MAKLDRLWYIFTSPSEWARKLRKWDYWIFTPSNLLTLRNVPRSWVDRDYRLLHANFSILCDFIEKERGGADGLLRDIEWRRGLQKKPTEEGCEWEKTNDCRWLKADLYFYRLYTWYNGIDWNDPVPMSEEYYNHLDAAKPHFVSLGNGKSELHHEGSPEVVARLAVVRAKYFADEKKFDKRCEKYLQNLIKLRSFLWT